VTEQFREQTDPLLLPDQAERLKGEVESLEGMLSAPPYIRNQIQDVPGQARMLRGLKERLSREEPKAYAMTDLDKAKKRERELVAEFTEGMPTQAEMRRNPAGAVDKHLAWEKRNKAKVMEWKNIRRRLHVSGDGDGTYEVRDLSNAEIHRPAGGPGEMNLDNCQIPGANYFIPRNVEARNVMAEDDCTRIQREIFANLTKAADEGDKTAQTILESIEKKYVPKEE